MVIAAKEFEPKNLGTCQQFVADPHVFKGCGCGGAGGIGQPSSMLMAMDLNVTER